MFIALSPEECVSLLKAFDFASANLIVYGGGINLEARSLLRTPGTVTQAAPDGSRLPSVSPEAARRLRFIRRSQELGFSLVQITELLALRVEPQQS